MGGCCSTSSDQTYETGGRDGGRSSASQSLSSSPSASCSSASTASRRKARPASHGDVVVGLAVMGCDGDSTGKGDPGGGDRVQVLSVGDDGMVGLRSGHLEGSSPGSGYRLRGEAMHLSPKPRRGGRCVALGVRPAVAIAARGSVAIWDTVEGTVATEWTVDKPVSVLAASESGELLATGTVPGRVVCCACQTLLTY